MDSDIEDLSDYENEEDDILRSTAELVPVNEVLGGENEAGDVHHTGPSSNITTSNPGSTSHITHRTQHEIMKIATWKNLMGQLKMKLSPLILSLNIFRIQMMASLLMNICERTNIVGGKQSHQYQTWIL